MIIVSTASLPICNIVPTVLLCMVILNFLIFSIWLFYCSQQHAFLQKTQAFVLKAIKNVWSQTILSFLWVKRRNFEDPKKLISKTQTPIGNAAGVERSLYKHNFSQTKSRAVSLHIYIINWLLVFNEHWSTTQHLTSISVNVSTYTMYLSYKSYRSLRL